MLETERLRLESPHIGFAEALLDLHIRNQEHFLLGSPRNLLEQKELKFWQNKLSAEKLMHTKQMQLSYYGFHKETGRLICHIQVSNIIRGIFQAAHIGYKIDLEYQGQGLMHEALQSVVKFLFEELNLHRLMANYQPHNLRSENLLNRMGFKREGYAEKYLYLDGEWRDHVLTSLTNNNFNPAKLG